jgi:hypothetical protein
MCARTKHRRALSLVEVVASSLIVAMMCVAALDALGAATRSSESIGNRAVAIGLADELMAEILKKPYEDPVQTPTFGRESGESATPRSGFDDVDDYNGWQQSPPQRNDGTTIPDRDDWTQRVTVIRVAPTNLTVAAATEQGAKRVYVAIEYRGQVLAGQYAVRTNTDEK